MSRTLIVLGVILVVLGLLWPWVSKIGLGRLPGDIVIQGEHFRFYFPLMTGLLISVLISLFLWLMSR